MMKTREKVLAGVVGLLALGYVGNLLFQQMLQGPMNEKQAQIDRLEQGIDSKKDKLRRASVAEKQLATWQQQSLPSDVELARSLYQNWLLELVRSVGFEKPNVDSGESYVKKDVYQRLNFTVRGVGTLEQLTKFLFDFYRADHLHQIQRLRIKPFPRSQQLELSMSLEALVLPGAVQKDRLNHEISDQLASENLVDYQVIVQRNLFGEGGATGFDPADFAFLTAILEVDGAHEAWFTVRTTGEVLKLHRGQSFEVGQFRGRVSEIDELDIIIDSDAERWLLTIGENLSQATALPPEF